MLHYISKDKMTTIVTQTELQQQKGKSDFLLGVG
jgi:hypothetical protein